MLFRSRTHKYGMAIANQEISADDPVGGTPGGGGAGSSINTGTSIFSLTFNKHEASSVLEVLAYASLTSPDDLQFTAYLTINGTIYQAGRVNVVLDNQQSKGAMPITLPTFATGLPAGNQSIVFSIHNQEPDGALTVLAGSTIKVTELKQGAM